MATFLQLVNDVERESGTVQQARRLSTVVSAQGRQEKIVEWVRQAWTEIQGARTDWTFIRQEFSHALTSGVAAYSASDLGITDFDGWLPETGEQERGSVFSLYDPAIGVGDQSRLRAIPYRAYRDSWAFGGPQVARPCVVSIGFDRKLNFGGQPDKAYTLLGMYRKQPQLLAADADVPAGIDSTYHRAIVWRALMLLGNHDEAVTQIQTAQGEYGVFHSRMLSAYVETAET